MTTRHAWSDAGRRTETVPSWPVLRCQRCLAEAFHDGVSMRRSPVRWSSAEPPYVPADCDDEVARAVIDS